MRLGVDLLSVDELDRLGQWRWFESYLFAPAEIQEAETMPAARRREYLAGRFAAKEAILKAFGVGLFQGVALRDICVTRSDSGSPEVVLRGSALLAARAAGIGGVSISITHKRGQVIAVAAAPSQCP